MWMLKWAGAAAVILAGAALGYRQGQHLSGRRMALQDALLLLRLVQVRMENAQGLWLNEIAAVAGDAAFQVLRFPQDIAPRAGLKTTLEAYLQACGADRLLGQPAAGWLTGALECAVTRQETAARLDYYSQLLREQLVQAQQREEQDKGLWLRLGWMGGILLTVILW